MMKISACIIAKNEEKNIAKCLESIYNVCDEIIVVDTGSIDKTAEIAREYSAKVIKSKWNEDFSEARNTALSYAKYDYILSIDADERLVNPSALTDIVKRASDDTGGFMVDIASANKQDGNLVFFAKNIRVFKNDKNIRYEGIVHEQIAPSIKKAAYKIVNSSIILNHTGYYDEKITAQKHKRNLKLLEKAIVINTSDINNYFNRGKTLMAMGQSIEAEKDFSYTLDNINKKHPMLTQVLNISAKNNIMLGNYAKVVDLAVQSLAINQSQIWANVLYADAEFILKQFKEAREHYKKAIFSSTLVDTNNIAGDMVFPIDDLYFRAGKCALAIKDYENASLDFKLGLKINPSSIDNITGIANVHYKLRNYSEARTLLLNALKLSNNNKTLLHFLEIVNDKVLPKELKIVNPDPTLSVCMIVKNEEKYLGDCLESIRNIADEIIVVDTGSTDNTIAIAETYGARVYHHEWEDDFSAARNETLMHATKDWILYIDADERLDKESANSLKDVISISGNEVGAIICIIEAKQKNLNGTEDIHRGGYPRLFRNYGYPRIKFHGKVHEQIINSIKKLGKESIISSLKINHIGYDTDEKVIFEKVQRNYKLLLKEIKENPRDAYSWYQLGQTLGQLKLIKESEDALLFAVNLGTLSDSIFSNTAAVLSHYAGNREEFETALLWAEKSLDKAPNFLYALNLKAYALLFLKRYDEAEEEFINALKLTDRKTGISDNGYDIDIPKEIILSGLQKARDNK